MPFIKQPNIYQNYKAWEDNTWKQKPCCSPEHNPPSHMVYAPGEYEYQCPACGHITKFTVHGIMC